MVIRIEGRLAVIFCGCVWMIGWAYVETRMEGEFVVDVGVESICRVIL